MSQWLTNSSFSGFSSIIEPVSTVFDKVGEAVDLLSKEKYSTEQIRQNNIKKKEPKK